MVFLLPPVNSPTEGGNNDADEGREVVEEAIGQVGEGGDAEDSALGESARVPGYEDGGDCGAILARAAEQAGFVAFALVGLAEHAAGEHDGEVLVGHGNVEEHAGSHGGGHEGGGATHEAEDDGDDVANLTGGREGSSEGLCADDEPDGGHHACHATGGDQTVEHGGARLDVGAAVAHLHDSLVGQEGVVEGALAIGNGYASHEVGLEHQCHDGRHENSDEEHYERRPTTCDHHTRGHRHKQQPGGYEERVAQGVHELEHVSPMGDLDREACHEEDEQGDDERRNGGVHHVADVGEEGCAGDARCQHGGVGEW